MRVLVVDDDLGSRLVAQASVQELGHECVTAADGDEAWQVIGELQPDVLISDRDMPGLDGLSLCRRLREQEADHYTYIVLLTALDEPDQVLSGMQAGADDYLAKPLQPLALQTRLLAAARVTALHEELAQARSALARQAHTDPLTGLRNRLGLAADLEQLHNVSLRYERCYGVAMCDIDHVKAYNDTYGHPAGDEALRAVAAALSAGAGQGDRVYRYGGEEFLALLPEQSLDEAAAAMEQVRVKVRALDIVHRAADTGFLTISIGIGGSRPGHRLPGSELVAEADTALYEAKRTGRNRVTVAGA